jgi:hypothetical protein
MIDLKAFFYPWNLNLEPLLKSIFLNTCLTIVNRQQKVDR